MINTTYAKRMNTLPVSCIREIMKAAESGEIISFAGGLPSTDVFPHKKLKQSAVHVIGSQFSTSLQYGSTEGIYELRSWIAENLCPGLNMEADPNRIIITSGSQQGLDIIGKTFLDHGDKVLVEKPSYLAALQTFKLYTDNFSEYNIGPDGPEMEMLRQGLSEKPRLLYNVPSFQNPTGYLYTDQIRDEMISEIENISRETVCVEDSPYSDLWYDSPPPGPYTPKLTKNRSVYLGTFSKTLAPGFRIGWLYSDRETVKMLLRAKQATDLCTSATSQQIVYHYLQNNNQIEHLDRIRQTYKTKRDYMFRFLKEHMPECVDFTLPGGGMFFWLKLPENIKPELLLNESLKQGVAFAPGTSFFANEAKPAMRLNFTHADFPEMEKGILILKKAIEKSM